MAGKSKTRKTHESAETAGSVGILESPAAIVPNVPNSNLKKEGTKMSKEETKKDETVTTPQEIEKTYKYFDLTDFELKEKTVKVNWTPAASYQEAVERLGNDQKILLDALNDAIKGVALSEKRKEVLSLGAPKKVALDFIKPFRMIPPYSSMVTDERGKGKWKDQYTSQTKALLKDVAGNEFMLNAIRAAAATSSDEDDNSDE